MTHRTCNHWLNDAYCGATEDLRQYGPGPRCPSHTPAALAGRPEVTPDPARTLDGIRAAAGLDPSKPMTPTGPTLADTRAIASGKRRSSPNAYRAAQAAIAKPATTKPATPAAVTPLRRDGDTIRPFDYDRLNGQAKRVYDVVKDGQWRTIPQIAEKAGERSHTAVQARMRDFRKPAHGGLNMEARRTDAPGVWEYRLNLTPPAATG